MKLGLSKCNRSPARACRCAMDRGCGVGCEGQADLTLCVQGCCGWRWCPFWNHLLPKHAPATSNALHRSVLQRETGNRRAEFVLYPPFFFPSENDASYKEKEVLTEKYLHMLAGSSPWYAGLQGASCALSLRQ